MTLLMGTGSHSAPCENCPVLKMLREVTAGHLAFFLIIHRWMLSSCPSAGVPAISPVADPEEKHLQCLTYHVSVPDSWLSAYPWNCLDTVMCCQMHKVNKMIGENIFPVNPLSVMISEVICVSGKYNIFRWRHNSMNQHCLFKMFSVSWGFFGFFSKVHPCHQFRLTQIPQAHAMLQLQVVCTYLTANVSR